jgi:cytochrome c oxidase subunit III
MAPALETEERKIVSGHGGGPRYPDFDDHGGRGWGDDGGPDRSGRPYVPGAGLLAMRFMLVSIAVLFITVGTAYFERSRTAVNWRHIQIPHLLWLSTALILASGWALECARGALERKNRTHYVVWLEVTVAIGVAFLGSQLFALRELMAHGFFLRHNPHSSLFYVVTGAHGLHLLGGIAALSVLLVRAALRPDVIRHDFVRQHSRIAVSALYWHFLTILWLGLFFALLLWP